MKNTVLSAKASPFPCLLFTAVTLLVASVLARPVMAHEFWIDPLAYQVDPGVPATANLRNGEMFHGVNIARFSDRFERLEWARGDETHMIPGRDGDRPAFVLADPGPGLTTLLYVSSGDKLIYDSWEIFERFTRDKGFPGAVARHDARGLPRENVSEEYYRFCKALVAVGDGRGADRFRGMRAEIVALGNPYSDDPAQGLKVRILQDGVPRAGAFLDVFRRDPAVGVDKTHMQADAHGEVSVPLVPGSDYMLSAVMLREGAAPTDPGAPMWESDWASLTFAVPEKPLE
ncbi:DUF4198 domain-containing protein [Rhodalgimonas zhirmunskyi]|uniref:DUF4198 domain-containing protein n=1 Tax=Rhodalgimonas zhirmunskyi TaxID=2964767 RepID=A0AAJ1X3S2_9RHOB|nr:DUF4198 domain-containing protein [Rhodoalgimonas zhirmunskyi]MDQ2092796.1 DUF4198 domain-containing protein [Rhodoalgimonas zhirmunskyi]